MHTLTLPPPSQLASTAHATLGRALVFATSFELDCRVLALSITIKNKAFASGSDDDFWKSLTPIVDNTLKAINDQILRELDLTPTAKDWLTVAREARNYIAHEAGESFEKKYDSPESFEAWLTTMERNIQELAVGKMAVAILLSKMPGSPPIDKQALREYQQRALSWVLHE